MAEQDAGASPIAISKVLKGIDFPASREDLVAHAEANGADEDVLDILEALPEGRYETMADVQKGVGSVA